MGVTNSKRNYKFSEEKTPLPSKWDALTKEYNSDNKKEQVENAKNNTEADKISKFIKDNTFLIQHFDNFMTDYKNKAETTALVKKNILPDRSDIKELLKGKNGNYNDELTQFLGMKHITPYNKEDVIYTEADKKLLDDSTDNNETQKKELYTKIIKVSIGALIHKKFKGIIVDYILGTDDAKTVEKTKRGDADLKTAFDTNKTGKQGPMELGDATAKLIEVQKNKNVKGGTLIENNVVDNNLEKVKSIGGINPLKAAKSFIDDDNNSSSSDNSDNSSSSSSSSGLSRYNSDESESDSDSDRSDESYSDSDSDSDSDRSDSDSDSDRSDESYSDRSDRSNGNNKSDSDNSNSFNDNSSDSINPHRVDYIKGEGRVGGGVFYDSNEEKVYKQGKKEIKAIFEKKKSGFLKDARKLNEFMDISENRTSLLAMVYDGLYLPGKWINKDKETDKQKIIKNIMDAIDKYTPDEKDEKTTAPDGANTGSETNPVKKLGETAAQSDDESKTNPAAPPVENPDAPKNPGALPGAKPVEKNDAANQVGGKYYKIKTLNPKP